MTSALENSFPWEKSEPSSGYRHCLRLSVAPASGYDGPLKKEEEEKQQRNDQQKLGQEEEED